jgi:cyanate permease
LIKRRSPHRIFFGWWIVIVTGLFSGLGHGVYLYGISALFKPIASELNFSRATTSIATGISRLEGGVQSPLTGWLTDKFGPRWIIFTGICIAATGLLLMNFIDSLWTYLIVWGILIGTGVNLALTIAVDKTIANWFISRRGLAQGTKFTIISIVAIIALPLITWQVAEYGWRITCMTWGGIIFVSAPFALLFVRQKRPEYYGLLPDGVKIEPGSEAGTEGMIDRGIEYAATFQEVEFTLRQALRTPAYWLLAVAVICQSIIWGGFAVHCIPFLTDIGINETAAGGMMGMMVFFSIPPRFLGGFIADKIAKNRLHFLLAGSFLSQAIGIGVFLLNPSVPMVYVMLILFGFGSGAIPPLYLLMLARYFGRKAYGSIFGILGFLRAPFQFLAPIYAGWVYDTTGSYTAAFLLFTITAVIAIVVLCLIRIPKAPAHISDIRQFL